MNSSPGILQDCWPVGKLGDVTRVTWEGDIIKLGTSARVDGEDDISELGVSGLKILGAVAAFFFPCWNRS